MEEITIEAEKKEPKVCLELIAFKNNKVIYTKKIDCYMSQHYNILKAYKIKYPDTVFILR